MILIRESVIDKLINKYGIREIAGRPLHKMPLDELLDHLYRVEMERRKGA